MYYGVWIVLMLQLKCHSCHKIVLCAVVRHGKFSLIEWMLYHQNLGVDHFQIYDNNDISEESIELLLLPFVNKLSFHIENASGPMIGERQLNLYRYCRKKYSRSDWIIQLDVDEYIVIHSLFKNLPELLDYYWARHKRVISFSWQYTCTWNRIQSYNLLCDTRPLELMNDLSSHVKSAYRVRSWYTRHSIHHMGTLEFFKQLVEADIAVVYHFYAKSLMDFLLAKFANRNDWDTKTNYLNAYKKLATKCMGNNSAPSLFNRTICRQLDPIDITAIQKYSVSPCRATNWGLKRIHTSSALTLAEINEYLLF